MSSRISPSRASSGESGRLDREVALKRVPPGGSSTATAALLYEALLHMVEHIDHKAFWPAQQPDAEIARRRAVIFRVLIASLAMPQDDSDLHKKGQDTPAS